jgi:hypothetical protein
LAVAKSKNYSEVHRLLGLKSEGKSSLIKKIRKLGLDTSHFSTYSYTEEELKEALTNSNSYLEIHRKLGLKGVGYKSLRKRIKQLNLDASHIPGLVGVHGATLSEILVKDSEFTHTGHLKEKLFKAGLKQPICEECDISEWRGQTIQFHLHHMNGEHLDNRLENLKILCPNCHSQTENYGHKNRGKGRPR